MEPTTKSKSKLAEPDPMDPAVVLTFADLDKLGRALRTTHITDKETLLTAIGAAAAVSVEGISISLEQRLLLRLKSRCLDKDNFPRFLREVIIRQLHDYAGW